MTEVDLTFEDRLKCAAKDLAAFPQLDIPVTHTFAPNAYVRTVQVPAGTMVVTKKHKTEHIALLSMGTCLVSSQHGTVELNGPAVFVTAAGTQRMVFCVTDVTWSTFHVTAETDLEKIESDITE